VFPAWHNAIGLGWVMVCFAVIAVLAMEFAYRWLPETKGLSVEEAVSVFERQNCSAIQVRDQGSGLPAVSA
jgi:hypothetical protein